MSVSVAALAIALVALAATLAVAVALARGRRASDERLTTGLAQVGAKMDGLARELATAVERVRRDASRARAIESLRQPLDPEELVARCAEAAAALPGVAASTVAVDVSGIRLEAGAGATSGLPVDPVAGPPGGGAVRAVAVSYHYAEGAEGRLHSAISVPLLGGTGDRLGFLTVFGAGEDPPVAGGEFLDLEEIARQAGPAIEESVRRDAAAPARPDPVTGLPARRELHETLALEVARARRQGTRLALCLLELDGVGAAAGGLEADALLASVAGALREAARPGDLVFRQGTAAFAVLARDAGRIEGEALVARLAASLPGDAAGRPRLGVSAGIAELKDDDDGLSLFARAERSLRREHGAGTAA